MARETCRGTKADGSPCESPIVDADGFCPVHQEGGSESISERGQKGDRARAKKDATLWAAPPPTIYPAGQPSPRREVVRSHGAGVTPESWLTGSSYWWMPRTSRFGERGR